MVWCIRFLKKWGFIGGKSKHFCDFSFLNLVPLREISYVQLILFSYTTLFSLYIFWLRGYPPFIQWQVASSPMLVGDNNSVGMGISVGDDLRLRSFESGDPYGYGLSAYLRCPWGNLHVNGLCHVLFPGEWLFFEKLPGCQTIFVAAGNYSIWAPHTKAEEMMPLDILGRYKTQSCVLQRQKCSSPSSSLLFKLWPKQIGTCHCSKRDLVQISINHPCSRCPKLTHVKQAPKTGSPCCPLLDTWNKRVALKHETFTRIRGYVMLSHVATHTHTHSITLHIY